MIHYFGGFFQGNFHKIMSGKHGFVSFANQQHLQDMLNICQSVSLDNGAYSLWKSRTKVNWEEYYEWVEGLKSHPRFDFAIIPDVIMGSEKENDALLDKWPLSRSIGLPVWHMQESIERLKRLANEWEYIAIGGSNAYHHPGDGMWWAKMKQAMDAICDYDGRPICKIHGLAMLNSSIFTRLPLKSADSAHAAYKTAMNAPWTGPYAPVSREMKACVIIERTEAFNSADHWSGLTPFKG